MSLLNNSKILKNRAFCQSFIVQRPATGAFDENGVWQSNNSPTEFSVSGSIQPIKDFDLNYLREATQGGARIKDAICIYSDFKFRPGALGANNSEADVIIYKGLTWGVIQVISFSPHGYDKVFGVRFDGQDD